MDAEPRKDDAASKIANASGRIVGSGVGGWGLPAAVTGLVAMFGTASTGTAISTLSGAALNSAVLAAIGFGSMATGGAVVLCLGVCGALVARKAGGRAGGKLLDAARKLRTPDEP